MSFLKRLMHPYLHTFAYSFKTADSIEDANAKLASRMDPVSKGLLHQSALTGQFEGRSVQLTYYSHWSATPAVRFSAHWHEGTANNTLCSTFRITYYLQAVAFLTTLMFPVLGITCVLSAGLSHYLETVGIALCLLGCGGLAAVFRRLGSSMLSAAETKVSRVTFETFS